MFKDYESKPITRRAMKITDKMRVIPLRLESTSRCAYDDENGEPAHIDFKHYEPVVTGDYIVYLTDDDIYHCTAEVFAERNIIP